MLGSMTTTEKSEATKTAYTMGELMVAAAAREIRDCEVVFVGMRLPLIAFVVAKKTHAPEAIGLFENGVIRATPSAELIYTMADPPNIYQATQCLDMLGVMSLLQSGRGDLGFLGAAGGDRVWEPNTGGGDRFGTLNSREGRPGARGRSREEGQGQDQDQSQKQRRQDATATAGGT